MGNRTEDNSKEGGSREKYITWSDDATQFMLEWYISLRKDKPTTFKWRKQHHQQCATALNDKLGLRVNRSQVHWHFRLCKEKCSWICAALGKSGYGFDATSCKFNIDPSEKEANKLGTTKYNYLTKPIKFFHLFEELFVGCSKADGSLAMDQFTANTSSDSDGSGSIKELEEYTFPLQDGGNDSDTIPRYSPTTDATSSGQKRKFVKSPTKKIVKHKTSRHKAEEDELIASILRLANSLASAQSVASVEVPSVGDPNASIWKRIEDLTIPASDKIELAIFLTKPEQECFRSYLRVASDESFQAWVIDYFGRKCATDGGYVTL
ncbi:uncharacterized protein [Oryza sativa Japonica Group]|uniref:Os04g0117150 protein n=2 Tax=Oryza sativa subsp. japonica TaxID=39947 RepID=Q7XT13_ORYSJ|nr:uncharacterized protein LOC107276960 [Oryza sativa Japonica Group]BAS87617.1 Os04g0117150 [Oryza sativa Japonica Group]CAE01719.2 OSJNBb0050O03.9 [Oryza sativa Japonica Group]